MRSLAILLLSLPLFAQAVDQTCATDTPGSDTTLTCTMGLITFSDGHSTGSAHATTSGATIIVIMEAVAGGASVTDSASQSYTCPAGLTLAVQWQQKMCYKENSASITTVTMSSNFGGDIMMVYSWTGLTNSSGFDQSASHDNGFVGGTSTNAAFSSGTTGSTAQASELVFGGCANAAANVVTYGAGAGFTAGLTSPDDANIFAQYKTVSSTGTQTAPGTYGGTSTQIECLLATFKIAAVSNAGGSLLSGKTTLGGKGTVQ